jgi:transposase-like protein
MPMFGTPLVSSHPEPVRVVRIPESVKRAIVTMVESGADFVSAGKRHGVKPQTMRRWLGRAECITFLRKERTRFRQSVCAQNEYVLAQIRDDNDGNQMARVRSIQVLEGLDEAAAPWRSGDATSPGITIQIVNNPPVEKPAGPVIDAVEVPALDEGQT